MARQTRMLVGAAALGVSGGPVLFLSPVASRAATKEGRLQGTWQINTIEQVAQPREGMSIAVRFSSVFHSTARQTSDGEPGT